MIPVDFHSHTFFSQCGLHSHVEMLTRARELGMAGLAITDHGPVLGGRIPFTFFDRMIDPVPGIRLLKGIEANLDGLEGSIDVSKNRLQYLDIVLLGLHCNTPSQLGADAYTALLIEVMDANPCVDMITHPADGAFPLRFDVLARAAAGRGVVLELNNSKLRLSRIDAEPVHRLVRACKAEGCRMAVSSDAHAINEVGLDGHARRLLECERFPSELIVNETAERAFAFIEERRGGKLV